jgi:hypothetical protein
VISGGVAFSAPPPQPAVQNKKMAKQISSLFLAMIRREKLLNVQDFSVAQRFFEIFFGPWSTVASPQ